MSMIDTDALKDCVEKSIAEFGGLYSEDLKTGLRMCVYIAEQQPEIVRCKDCKWFNDIGCAIYIVDDSDKPTENDYCSYGERREVSE